MNQNRDFLATEPIGRLLVRLALPTVTAQLINMLYNIVDRIYIGHMPGDGALALTGMGVCMPLIMLVSAFTALVGSGGAPRASIAMGRGDEKEAERILGNCCCALLTVGTLLTATLLLFSRPLLLLFGASGSTIGYAVDYMHIYALGTLFVQLTLGLNAFITAQGFTSISMRSVLIGAVSNILLDPVFIYFFDMGVAGAALATILSQGLSCLWVLRFLTGPRTRLRLRRENVRLERGVILPCMALGLAAFIMQSSESLLSVCFNTSLAKYGGDLAVGAMTILSSVMQFAMLPLSGLGQGAQPIISYNFGAGNTPRVRSAFSLLLRISLGYSLTLWALVMLFPRLFAAIFTSDAALLDYAARALRIYLAALGIFGVQVACQMTFTAIGSAKASITVAVMRKFVLLIPLIYLLPNILPIDQALAVYLAEPVADLLAVSFTAALFFTQFRKME
ncbi:MAG: MATE family efflux transporter [Clostridia bacterium]|nr:MATE family efflux transporter [Clostridia bacterium]